MHRKGPLPTSGNVAGNRGWCTADAYDEGDGTNGGSDGDGDDDDDNDET